MPEGHGGDAVAATELKQTNGPTLLNGWDTLTFAARAAGVRAVVWGTASSIPEQCIELRTLLIDDIDLAREIWARLWPLCQSLEGHGYPAAVKTACRVVGDTTGPVRAPLLASTTPRPASSPTCSSTQPSRRRHRVHGPCPMAMPWARRHRVTR